jgi:S-adenosylmethionine:tRNA ribosyltransferase-isomerase
MQTISKFNFTVAKEFPAPIFVPADHQVSSLDFNLPPELEASEPPEARGLARDEVRLMVSHKSDNQVTHTQFRDLPDYLNPGDVLVINTSGTMNAALKATREDGKPFELHLSTRLPANLWIVEVRQSADNATKPFYHATPGEILSLRNGGSVTLHAPYLTKQRTTPGQQVRLWIATISIPGQVQDYLTRNGFPIRYSYVDRGWPIDIYQTVYTTETGSAEMPSAGRAFTSELMTQLLARGIQIAPLLLHTGVASQEDHEPPYEEFYRVPPETAQLVNNARALGRRAVAVGTTSVRALETVTDTNSQVHPGEGWTNLVITPERGLRVVNAILTGLHEPKATHLAMLQALTGLKHLQITYAEALRQKYLWHEFGDLHLILP